VLQVRWRVRVRCVQKVSVLLCSSQFSTDAKRLRSQRLSNADSTPVSRTLEGGKGPQPTGFWNLEFFYYIFTKKVCFPSFEREKLNFTIFATSGKIQYCPHWKKLIRRPWTSLLLCMWITQGLNSLSNFLHNFLKFNFQFCWCTFSLTQVAPTKFSAVGTSACFE